MSTFTDKLKVFFGFETTPQLPKATTVTAPKTPSIKTGFKATLVQAKNPQALSLSQIRIEEPRIYEDSLNIATYLRQQIPVIVNLKYLEAQAGKRLIDFVCGTSYAINGHMLKIGENIFLFTPNHIVISDASEKTTLERGVEESQQAELKSMTAS